ncbi:MAG: GNAT family N-acetyltransferase [Boseongicola sp.]|nr:GNAT family N-acetyltransferase [Boseongicola sp.]
MIGAHEKHATPEAVALAHQLSANIPTLHTDRLTLRPLKLEDFATLADLLASDRSRFVGGPMSRMDAWQELTQLASGWVLHGHGGWAIDHSGSLSGFVLIGVEPGDHERELGFLLTEEAEGHGIAYEAASAARNFAFDVLKFPTLVSYIDVANTRSHRLAERLGGERDALAEAKMNNKMRIYRYTPKGAHS